MIYNTYMELKVITLNVEHGGKLMDNVLNFLERERPDILFLQEVYNSSDTDLERRFRTFEIIGEAVREYMPYGDFKGYAYDPDVRGEMGNAIFSKFEMHDTGNFFFDVPYGEVTFTREHHPPTVPRELQWAKVSINSSEVWLCNLHGIWGEDGFDNPRRIKMAEDIAGFIHEKQSVILAGDTNFDAKATKTVEIIEKAGVASVFGNSLVSTFNMAHKTDPGYATAVVDMIFVSPVFEIIEKYMPMDDVSDHRPLAVILIVR